MEWAQVLVIVLAVLFALFLLFAIILAVLLIRVTQQIKAAASSAERTVHALEDSMSTMRKSALPLMAARAIVKQAMKRQRGK